jgi:hypothetical protein
MMREKEANLDRDLNSQAEGGRRRRELIFLGNGHLAAELGYRAVYNKLINPSNVAPFDSRVILEHFAGASLSSIPPPSSVSRPPSSVLRPPSSSPPSSFLLLTSLLDPSGSRPPKEDISKMLEELEGLVGLQKVKEFVRNLEKRAEVMRERKKHGLGAEGRENFHMAFIGPPGTGMGSPPFSLSLSPPSPLSPLPSPLSPLPSPLSPLLPSPSSSSLSVFHLALTLVR